MTEEHHMQRALQLARQAAELGEVPVGALIVKDDTIIAEGANQPIKAHDPTAHAEIVAMRRAADAIGNYRLVDTTLYVTLEPCAMCVGAIMHARIKRVVFGAYDPKAGAVESQLQLAQANYFNHRIGCTGGILADECGSVLKAFFQARR